MHADPYVGLFEPRIHAGKATAHVACLSLGQTRRYGTRSVPATILSRGFEGRQRLFLELIDVADDFGDGGVLLGGDLAADFDVGVERAGEFFALDDGDAAFQGEA